MTKHFMRLLRTFRFINLLKNNNIFIWISITWHLKEMFLGICKVTFSKLLLLVETSDGVGTLRHEQLTRFVLLSGNQDFVAPRNFLSAAFIYLAETNHQKFY